MSILERFYRFIIREFILSEGKYHKPDHMTQYADICERTVKFVSISITFSRVACMKLRATYMETLITFLHIDCSINLCYCHIVIYIFMMFDAMCV
jgi:hypothetical protein